MQDSRLIELDKQAVIQVGDTTIIASASYQENGENCFDKIANVLKEEVGKQPYD